MPPPHDEMGAFGVLWLQHIHMDIIAVDGIGIVGFWLGLHIRQHQSIGNIIIKNSCLFEGKTAQ